MKILSELTIKNLKLNKSRTIVTIIGIVLSCALITGLAGLISSFIQTSIDAAVTSSGDRHVTFFNVPKEEIKYLTKHKETDDYYIQEGLGYSYLEDGKNSFKPYLYVLAMDDKAMQQGNFILDGRLPNNSNEIVISEHILYDGLVEYEIGDELTLEIGNRVSDEYNLYQNNPYNEEESLDVLMTKEYVIVGVMKRPGYENFSAPGYTVITKLDEIDSKADVSLLYKNVEDYSSITAMINGTQTDIEKGKYYYEYNIELLRYLGVGLDDSTINSIYALGGIVASIIIISSVFCIRNSFAISITEKTKQYGMLSSMGATPKQIKKNVLFEGFILGFIGIILGVLSGILATYILVWLVNNLLFEQLSIVMVFSVSWFAILISVLLSCVTIYLSCIFPARKASKLTEIQAIRLTEDIKIKNYKTPKIIKEIGVGQLISYKNMKRNKKKFRITIISLTVSIFTFISLSSFLDIGFGSIDDVYKSLDHNIRIENYQNINFTEFDDILTTDMMYSIHNSVFLEVSPNNLNKSDEILSIAIYSVGELEYGKYIEKLNLNYEEIFDKGILIDTNIYDYQNNEFLDEKNIKENIESLELSRKDYFINLNIERVDSYPMGFIKEAMHYPILIVSDKLFNEIILSGGFDDANFQTIYIDSFDDKEATKKLNTYFDNNDISLEVFNISEEVEMMRSSVLVISIFLYGFITVITLIGVTSIFNTITTNMNLRKNDFAMMKSIGMSSKEFNNMILFESCLYGVKSLLYGIPLGILGSYLIYKSTTIYGNDGILATEFQLPLMAILISVVFVFIIIFIIMKFSLIKINKQNIIETIRNENV